MSYDPEYHKRYREENRERIRERKRQEYLANKEAIKERSRAWSANNRDQKLAVGAVYRERTREERNQYMRDRYHGDPDRHISAMSAWRKANPEKYRDQYLRNTFGMTLAEYEALLAKQGGVCAICGHPPKHLLAVDHDHANGKVRGLLCTPCNTGIGHLKDSPIRMRRAAEYIESSMEAN
jgi:hypothetical protein